MAILKHRLNTKNHDRDVMGMRYVYPVISRRAGGVSIGINLNPNNACNWHCAYCQVPDLIRGSAPDIDLQQLHDELSSMLLAMNDGDFMQNNVSEDMCKLCDVAISGNGEPTSCQSFDAVVEVIVDILQCFDLVGKIPLRLITNGSYVHKQHVQAGLKRMAQYGGEVWVKMDAATREGIARINGVNASPDVLIHQINVVAKCCPTWIQTCMLAWDKEPPEDPEISAYLKLLKKMQRQGGLQGVLLYGLARPSLQKESLHVSALNEAWMLHLKERIECLGVSVRLSL